ncbi:MAG: hypothetical protein LBS21_01545 [Clostridiales bacterium]|jgi:hypothetical protein|nr:hypothetical protein [Clostridiales bacterium]
MTIKNISPKILGIGGTEYLPGESKPLPKGMNESNSLVDYFIKQKLISVVAAVSSEDSTGTQSPGSTATEDSTGTQPPGNAANEDDKSITGVSRMSLAELRETATKHAIPFEEADTRAVLIEKITKHQAEQE